MSSHPVHSTQSDATQFPSHGASSWHKERSVHGTTRHCSVHSAVMRQSSHSKSAMMMGHWEGPRRCGLLSHQPSHALFHPPVGTQLPVESPADDIAMPAVGCAASTELCAARGRAGERVCIRALQASHIRGSLGGNSHPVRRMVHASYSV